MITRRTFIKGSAGVLVAGAIAQQFGLPSLPRASAADPPPVAPSGVFTPPYSAIASSNLSEDYFLTNEVILGSDDHVLPFQRPDGTVEALVFNQSAINYLQRDATSSSGWTYSAIPFPLEWFDISLLDCAVQLGSDGNVYCVFTQQDPFGGEDEEYLIVDWMMLPAGSTTWNIATIDFPEAYAAPIGPLGSSVDPSGHAIFYSVNSDGTANVWQPQATYTGSATQITGLPVETFTDAALIWNPGWNGGTPAFQAGAIIVTTSAGASLYLQNGPASVAHNADFVPFALIAWLGWAQAIDDQSPNGPAYVAQGTDGIVRYSDGISGQFELTTLSAVAGQAAIWTLGGMISGALLVGSTATIVTQYDNDPQSIAFTAGIPIIGDLTALTGCPTDPQQGTLFVTDETSTLQVATKDPTTGIWTVIPVSQSTATTQALSTWRIQLELFDSNGLLLLGSPVAITPTQAIGIWQPTGGTNADPNTPFTTTTDDHGLVTFAVVASEVDAPMLTVQVYDGTTPSGPPLSVNPAQPVHDFFTGTGSLDGIGMLTAANSQALIAAQGSNGPLFPVLANISDPTQQMNAANAVGAAVNQCMMASKGAPAPDAIQSFALDFTSGTPVYTPSPPPDVMAVQGVGSWFSSAQHDIESVYHGIRHGLIDAEKTVSRWDADAKNWAVTMAIKIGDEISDTVTYAIDDIRSAIHAISGFFNKLGAEIEDVIAWLRTTIGETLRSAAANTATMIGWLENMGTQLSAAIGTVSMLEKGFFASLETKVTNELDMVVIPGTSGQTLGDYNSMVPNPPGSGSGGNSLPEKIAKDVVHIWHDATGNWLIDKIHSEFDSLLQTPGGSDPVTTALNKLESDVRESAFMQGLADTIWNALDITEKSQVKNIESLAILTLLELVVQAVPEALAFADTVISDVLALLQAMVNEWVSMLQTNLLHLPLISEILKLVGIDLQLEVGHMFGLMLMFPTTIGYRIAFGGDGTMFNARPAASGLPGANALAAAVADPLGHDLGYAHAAIRGASSIVDMLGDTMTAIDPEDNPSRLTPLKWTGYLDTITNSLINVTTYPGQKNSDGTTAPPFTTTPLPSNPTSLDQKVFGRFLVSWMNPILSGAAQVCSATALVRSAGTWMPLLRGAVGGTLFGLGIDINIDKNAAKEVITGGALEASAPMLSPLALGAINEDTLFIPLAVKLVVDGVGEPTASMLIYENLPAG